MLRKSEPPSHLSAAARKLWVQLNTEYDLADASAQALLELALVAYDRAHEARVILAKQGLVVRDKNGKVRAHPMCAVERDAAKTFGQTLRLLNLDVEPLAPKAGRQPGDWGKRHAYQTTLQTSRAN